MDRCYQGELARQEELKLALESQHIPWTHKTITDRRIYFEAIDLMKNAIDQRFDQQSFDTYAKTESLLIKTLNSQDKSEELKFMEKLYNDDVNISVLTAQMEIVYKCSWRMVIIFALTTS